MSERGYHHGDLRNALLAATADLVRERGARGFSVSEAARRVGVSSSAPYRHFADRDDMLAAAALAGFVELEERFERLRLEDGFVGTAMRIADEYVRFAREDPARFEVMFAHGIDKAGHAELLQQTCRIQARLEAVLGRHLPTGEASRRAAEIWSLAHGVAELVLGGNVQHVLPEDGVGDLARSVSSAWARGVSGAGGAEPTG